MPGWSGARTGWALTAGRSRTAALVAAADWIEKARAGWNEAFGRMDELLDALESKEMKDD